MFSRRSSRVLYHKSTSAAFVYTVASIDHDLCEVIKEVTTPRWHAFSYCNFERKPLAWHVVSIKYASDGRASLFCAGIALVRRRRPRCSFFGQHRVINSLLYE